MISAASIRAQNPVGKNKTVQAPQRDSAAEARRRAIQELKDLAEQAPPDIAEHSYMRAYILGIIGEGVGRDDGKFAEEKLRAALDIAIRLDRTEDGSGALTNEFMNALIRLSPESMTKVLDSLNPASLDDLYPRYLAATFFSHSDPTRSRVADGMAANLPHALFRCGENIESDQAR